MEIAIIILSWLLVNTWIALGVICYNDDTMDKGVFFSLILCVCCGVVLYLFVVKPIVKYFYRKFAKRG